MSRNLAEGATKEESAMLTNSVTSKKREVDVVLRTRTAGVELVIGIEATGLSEALRQASPQPEASLQPDPVDAGGGANRFGVPSGFGTAWRCRASTSSGIWLWPLMRRKDRSALSMSAAVQRNTNCGCSW